jgi:hypothetical protein
MDSLWANGYILRGANEDWEEIRVYYSSMGASACETHGHDARVRRRLL